MSDLKASRREVCEFPVSTVESSPVTQTESAAPATRAAQNAAAPHPEERASDTKLSRFLEGQLNDLPPGHQASLELSGAAMLTYGAKASGKAEVRRTESGGYEVTLEASAAGGMGAKRESGSASAKASAMLQIKGGTTAEFESAAQCAQFLDAALVAGVEVSGGLAVKGGVLLAQGAGLVADEAAARVVRMLKAHGTKISLGGSLETEVKASIDIKELASKFGAQLEVSQGFEVTLSQSKEKGYTLSVAQSLSANAKTNAKLLGPTVEASGQGAMRLINESVLTRAQFEGLKDGSLSLATVLKGLKSESILETEVSGSVQGGLEGAGFAHGMTGEMKLVNRRFASGKPDETSVTFRPMVKTTSLDFDKGPLEASVKFNKGPEFEGATLAEAQAKAVAAEAQEKALGAAKALAHARH